MMKRLFKKIVLITFFMVIPFLPSASNATSYSIVMTDGTSGHPTMGNIVHYPTLWSGVWSSPTDYLITYLKFDLTSISDTEQIDSIILTGSELDSSGSPSINAYHVNDDTLGGTSYSSYTYNQFHTVDQYLGAGTEVGNNWSWNIAGYDYSGDIQDNVLTIALTSFDSVTAYNYRTFDRNLSLIINTSPSSVPEPSTLLLLGSGLVGLVGMRRRFKA